MSPTKEPPSPKLYEPYENHKYADLRHELSVRNIRLPRSVQRINDQAGFIQLLRDWDQTQNVGTPRPNYRRASPRRTQDSKNQNQLNSSRTVRTRRGCRFRLINVLLSPKFSRRWAEMISRGRKVEVNRFWMDVHVAYMAKNASLDTLHFQDSLFVNVTPNVILAHSAARLLQMWVEIVVMYRNAVAQTKKAAAKNDTLHSFFDFCAGRLDLLYLHMAMLLEPKLFKFIMSDKLSVSSEPFSKRKTKTVDFNAEAAQTAVCSKSGALEEEQAVNAVGSKPVATVEVQVGAAASSKPGTIVEAEIATVAGSKPGEIIEAAAATIASSKSSTIIEVETDTFACSKPGALTESHAASTTNSNSGEKIGTGAGTTASSKPCAVFEAQAASSVNCKPNAAAGKAKEAAPLLDTTEAPAPPILVGVLTQNPEMNDFSVFTGKAIAKQTVAENNKSGLKAKQSQPAASLYKASVPKKVKKSVNGKMASTGALTKQAKSKALPVRQKPATGSSKSKAVSSASLKLSAIGNSYAQETLQGKRPREEEETAIVKIPTIRDIVSHSKKRVHTTATLAMRPADVVLPPDEWDILESRLRKVNDNIDRCHRGLSSMEGNVSDSYKQSLEADLRFYSAIKQRLQEQLLVVMQSGY